MNDYKELIGDIGDCLIAHPSETLCKRVLREAADAIERLVKERDEWKTLGSLANKRAEDYREMRRQRDKTIKERDAAIADLKTVALNCHEDYTFSACFACEHNSTCNGQPPSGCEFEWRGVREDDDEID